MVILFVTSVEGDCLLFVLIIEHVFSRILVDFVALASIEHIGVVIRLMLMLGYSDLLCINFRLWVHENIVDL